jgi:hypothetical protein
VVDVDSWRGKRKVALCSAPAPRGDYVGNMLSSGEGLKITFLMVVRTFEVSWNVPRLGYERMTEAVSRRLRVLKSFPHSVPAENISELELPKWAMLQPWGCPI